MFTLPHPLASEIICQFIFDDKQTLSKVQEQQHNWQWELLSGLLLLLLLLCCFAIVQGDHKKLYSISCFLLGLGFSLQPKRDALFSCVSSSITLNFTSKQTNRQTNRHLGLLKKRQVRTGQVRSGQVRTDKNRS